jgi:flavin-dependent dehydrogenase
MTYDVIVVGAGPAGSTAARECAAAGLSTLLLDKAAFPRDKPCGGGVNLRTARLLPFDLTPVTERVAMGIVFSLRGAPAFMRTSTHPLTYLTERRRLDAFLVEQAIAARAPQSGRSNAAARTLRSRLEGGRIAAGSSSRLTGRMVRPRCSPVSAVGDGGGWDAREM